VLPLCFGTGGSAACPTGTRAVGAGAAAAAAHPFDVALVETLGLLATAVAAVTALRTVRGTSLPYGLAIWLGCLSTP
jgi:hypothetical protein